MAASTDGSYRTVLGTVAARRLLVSTVLARLPQGMSLAVLLLVRESAGSFAAAGAVVGALGVSTALLTPWLGRRIDRDGPRRVLLVCAAQQAAALIGLVLAATVWDAPVVVLVLLGGLAGARQPPVAACARVLWPTVVRTAAARETAFTLDATAQDTIWVAGPVLVSVLVVVTSPAVAVCAMPVVGLLGVAWFVAALTPAAWPREPTGRTEAQALRPLGVRVILVAAFVAGLDMGSVEVGLPGLARELGSPNGAGALLALSALSSVVGGVVYGFPTWRAPVDVRLRRLLALSVLLVAPLALAGSMGAALALAALSGLGWAPALACVYSLVGRLAPPRAITEAFAWGSSAIGGGIALGSAIAGWLVEHSGSPAAFGFSAGASATACGLVVAGRRWLRAR